MQEILESAQRPDGSQVFIFSDGNPVEVALFLEEQKLDLSTWAAEFVHRGVERSAQQAAASLSSTDENCRVEIAGVASGQYRHVESNTFFDLSAEQVYELLSVGLAAALVDVESVLRQGFN